MNDNCLQSLRYYDGKEALTLLQEQAWFEWTFSVQDVGSVEVRRGDISRSERPRPPMEVYRSNTYRRIVKQRHASAPDDTHLPDGASRQYRINTRVI